MSMYTNSTDVKITEVARLHFYDTIDDVKELIIELAMPIEHMRNLHIIIGQALQQFDNNVQQQKIINKGMN